MKAIRFVFLILLIAFLASMFSGSLEQIFRQDSVSAPNTIEEKRQVNQGVANLCKATGKKGCKLPYPEAGLP
jgi:hypothetical protein